MVSVSASSLFSAPVPLLSYAAPSVTQVVGCQTSSHAGLSVHGCERSGGDVLTVHGYNFGLSGARLFIGATECNATLHIDHSRLLCTVPPGAGADRPVLVLQRNGVLNQDVAATVSYRPCPTGRFQEGVQCLTCAPGRAVDVDGALECKPCIPGFYAPAIGQVSVRLAIVLHAICRTTVCHACQDPSSRRQARVRVCCAKPACTRTRRRKQSASPALQVAPVDEMAASRATNACRVVSAPRFRVQNVWLARLAELPSHPDDRNARCVRNRRLECVIVPLSQPCAAGTFAAEPGAARCSPCSAGRFQDLANSTLCFECLAGRFSPTSAAVACLDCRRGRFGNSSALSDCFDCVAGKFQSSSGQAGCEPCGRGKYSLVGQPTACTSCEPGRFAPAPASSGCFDCPVGRASSGGASECQNCTGGFYQPSAAQAQCLQCRPGQYVVLQQQRCALCPPRATCDRGLVIAGAGLFLVRQGDGQVTAITCSGNRCRSGYECMANEPSMNQSTPDQVHSTQELVVCCGPNRDPLSLLCATCLPGFIEVGSECIGMSVQLPGPA